MGKVFHPDQKILDFWFDEVKLRGTESDRIGFIRPVSGTIASKSHAFPLESALAERLNEVSGGSADSKFLLALYALQLLMKKYHSADHQISIFPFGDSTSGPVLMPLANVLQKENQLLPGVQALKTRLTQIERFQNFDFEELNRLIDVNGLGEKADFFGLGFALAGFSKAFPEMEQQFGLYFKISADQDHKQLEIHYQSDLYDAKLIDQLAQHYMRSLAFVLSHIRETVEDFRLLNEEEKELQIAGFNDTSSDWPSDKSVPELFREMARRFPDRMAIRFGDNSLNYHELDQKTDALALALRTQYDFQHKDVAGIMLDRSEMGIVASLGILKAGGSYIVIDPTWPAERKKFIIEDSGMKTLLISSEYLFDIDDFEGGMFAMDLQLDDLPEPDPVGMGAEIDYFSTPEDIAYIIYTSGSTGRPKGVRALHKGIVRLVRDTNYVSLNQEDVLLSLSSFAFDGSTFDIYGALLNGGTCSIASQSEILDSERLKNLIEDEGVTCFFLTTALFNSLIDFQPAVFENLRKVLFGGEQCSVRHVEEFVNRFGPGKLLHVYGPTENTTFSSWYSVDSIAVGAETIPIGKAIGNSACYILDDSQQLLPLGVPGELCVAGEGLAAGYLGDDELTSQKFVGHPFAEGEKMYRTGDLARLDQDGNIVFIGRIDQQVKIRGFRIEPGEIQAIISENEQVREAFVVVNETKEKGRHLIAYVILKGELLFSELVSWLEERLPSYMIPAQFVRMDRFPLNASGKIDRKSLPKASNLSGGGSADPLTTPVQKAIGKIWAEQLQVEDIGLKDNYFTLGGDSIKAIRLVSLLNEQMGCRLEVKDVFARQDIGSLAMLVEDAQKGPAHSLEDEAGEKYMQELRTEILNTPENASLLPQGWEDFFPMSDIQKGMAFYYIANLGTAVYHMQILFEFQDLDFKPGLLRKAWNLMEDKHAIFRTGFYLHDFSEPLQVVFQSGVQADEYLLHQLDELSLLEQKSFIRQELANDRERYYSLGQEKLYRLFVYDLGEGKITIGWSFHHALLDGWSDSAAMTEWLLIYQALKDDPGYAPVALQANYKDYLRDQLNLKSSDETTGWWKNKLTGYVRSDLPLNRIPRKLDLGRDRREAAITIDPHLQGAMTAFALENQFSSRNILLAAFYYFIQATTNSNDVTWGILTHARPSMPDSEKIIGCFLNSAPFRFEHESRLTGMELIQMMGTQVNEMKAHDKLSLFTIMDLLQEQSGDRNPFFDMLFNYVDFHVVKDADSSKLRQSREFGHAVTNTAFDFTVRADEKMLVYISASDYLYSNEELSRLLGYYHAALRHLIFEPNKPLNAEYLLSRQDKQLLLKEWQGEVRPLTPEMDVIPMFEAAVAHHPEKTAVLWENESNSWDDLNREANQIAHELLQQGIQPGMLVGLLVDRTPKMLAAVLGILKTGAGYVPVDPKYPMQRTQLIIEDSQFGYLVSTAFLADSLGYSGTLINLDELAWDSLSDQNPGLEFDSDHTAYIVYTSGSTGRPKGVQLSRGNIRAFVDWCMEEYREEDFEVIYAGTSYCFDLSVFELLYSTASGTTVRIMDSALDVPTYTRQDKKIFLSTVPSVLSELIRQGFEFEHVTHLNLAGEASTPELIRNIKAHGVRFRNLYGPCEDTVYSTCYPPEGEDHSGRRIGNLIAHTQGYILSKQGDLLPPGVAGELYISGEQLSEGYLNRDELNQKCFLPNPFLPGKSMYKSGDLVRWFDNGDFEFIGRADRQVKIRGFRVEPREVESIITNIENVLSAAVVPISEPGQSLNLAGYYSGKNHPDPQALRKILAEILPVYMIPTWLIALDEMPLTANGKIDAAKLPRPGSTEALASGNHQQPANPTEKLLFDIWKEVLGHDDFGTTDNFFGVGGHSLRATRLAGKILKTTGAEIKLRDVFEDPTIVGLARLMEKRPTQELEDAIQPIPMAADYALSHAQRRMWFLSQVGTGNAQYNMPMAFSVEGIPDTAAWQKAIDRLIGRHESLRTRFEYIGQEPRQVIEKRSDTKPLELDFRDQKDAALAAKAHLDEWIMQPFDLAVAPLIRFALLRLEDQKYVVAINMHHIISDGWSVGILLKELFENYSQAVQDQETVRDPLPIQYKDFAVWQNQLIDEGAAGKQRDYWMEALKGDLPVVDLPADFPRPGIKTTNGGRMRFTIPEELTKKFRGIVEKEEASLFMGLVALVKVLIFRYTRQDDIIVGTPVAGRVTPELDQQIGLYLNTLALRDRIDGDETFSEFIQRVKATVTDALDNQSYPFDKLIDELNPVRDMSRTPLFDISVGLQNLDFASVEGESSSISPFNPDFQIAKFDLAVAFLESGDHLVGELEYSTDLFKVERMERLTGHLIQLMESIVNVVEASISALPMLTSSEIDDLNAGIEESTVDWPKSETLVSRFEQTAKQFPNRKAVVWGDVAVNYSDLNARANRLAHLLQRSGIGAGDRVGLLMERSNELVSSVLAVLKAGAGYVPVDPNYPESRQQFMLQDSGCKVLITDTDLNVPAGFSGKVIVPAWELSPDLPDTNPEPVNQPNDLAYIIYTSGSTGNPKGVMVAHQNVVRLFFNENPLFDFSENDTWSLFHSYCFDFSVWEMYGALLFGGKLVVVPGEVTKDPSQYAQLLIDQQVTVLNQTPGYFYQLSPEILNRNDDPALRMVIFGGEALSPAKLSDFRTTLPDISLVNMYGITETTVHVTYKEIGEDEIESNISNIGKPIPTLYLEILDEHLCRVPEGIPGELCVGGAGLAKGYLNNAPLTAEKFVDNPYRAGEKLYRSGDLGRKLPNGEFEYLGRIDRQAKIRGFRIESGEIEHALRQHDDIKDVVVTTRKRLEGENYLVAYFTAENAPGLEDLRTFMQKMVPIHAVPAAFVPLDHIPLTSNGKTDFKALPDPMQESLQDEEAQVPPRNDREATMVSIWENVLGKSDIGITDNFFNLGGDSMRSIQVVRMAAEAGLQVSIQDIFTWPQIQLLLENAGNQSAQIELVPDLEPFEMLSEADRQRIPTGVEDAYPLSFLQQGMYFHSTFDEGSAVYHDVFTYYLKYPFVAEQFAEAVSAVMQREDILRTSFNLSGFSAPLQMVHSQVNPPITVVDLQDRSPEEIRTEIENWAEEEKNRAFDWEKPPLISFRIHLVAEGVFGLSLSFHHAILDGWSVATMVSGLLQEYFALHRHTRQPEVSKGGVRFRDFVYLENEMVQSAEPREFWQDYLKGFVPSELPQLPGKYIDGKAGEIDQIALEFSSEVSDQLKSVASSAETPIKSVLLAAHLKLLSLLCGTPDVVTGIVSNCRLERPGGDQSLGLYLNTLPFRQVLDDGSWKTLIQQSLKIENKMLPFRRFPVAEIQNMPGNSQLFDISFNYTHFHAYDSIVGDDELKILASDGFEQTNYSLVVNFSQNPVNKQIYLNLIYDKGRFSEGQAADFAKYYTRILEQIASDAGQNHHAFSLLNKEENLGIQAYAAGLENSWNGYQSVLELMETQVESYSEKTALVEGEEKWTYAELNERANQLAHELIETYDVSRGDRVGILLGNSMLSVVAILGAMKAGAAYVPIDPGYPESRKEFLIRDANPKVLILDADHLFGIDYYEGGLFAIDLQLEGLETPKTNPGTLPGASDPAYVIYTSGSSGQPKGVLVPHGALSNYIRWARETYLDAGDWNLPLYSPLSFDLTVTSLFLPLVSGNELHIFASDSPEVLLRSIFESEAIHLLKLTPSHLEIVRQLGLTGSSVKAMILGGEALSAQLAADVSAQFPGVKIYNEYGPTEATVGCTLYQFNSETDHDTWVSIGTPIANAQVYVMDESLNSVPVGVPGEIVIGGEGVALGYLNQEELTAAKFIDSPHATEGKLYRTGDLGYLLPDGNLEFLNRIDRQLKIRGYRIEPGEIETAILATGKAKQCVVGAFISAQGEATLTCWYLQNESFDPEGIKSDLRKSLPGYMVPSLYVEMDEIPLTPNGKTDFDALPSPDAETKAYVAPGSETEEKLVEILAEVLEVERVGVEDDFFALGGHSLKAVRLVSKIRMAFGVQLTVRDVFEFLTPASLAEQIDQRDSSSQEEIPLIEEAPFYPVSHAQHRMWVVEQIDESSITYNMPASMVLQGSFDVIAFEKAWKWLMNRHESLRTTFSAVGGVPRQVVHRSLPFAIAVIDLSQEVDPMPRVHELIRENIRTPFDLSQGPLVRSQLIRLEAEKWVWLFNMHHIISDGWSVNVLTGELMQAYESFRNDQAPLAPELRIQYKDYAAWQNSLLEESASQSLRKWWMDQFSGELLPLDLPLDYPRPAIQTNNGRKVILPLPEKLSASVDQASKSSGASHFMVLLALTRMLLFRLTRQEDLVIGTPVAGRDHEDLHHQIGLYLNTLPLRLRLQDGVGFSGLLESVKTTVLDAYDHQLYPFDRLVDDLALERDLSRSPLFDVMVVMQNTTEQALELEGLAIGSADTEDCVSLYDLVFNFGWQNGKGSLILEYNTDLFRRETIDQICRSFVRLSENAMQQPEIDVAALETMSEDDLNRVMEWSGMHRTREVEQSFVERFESNAERTPDRIALEFKDEQLTYAELNERANALGNYLTDKSIGRNDLVGVSLDKSTRLIVSILGVMKAGAAYVPLDPTTPSERSTWILENAEIDCLVTQEQYLTDFEGWPGELITDWPEGSDAINHSSAIVGEEDLAYVIYTSGSTGKPKGVAVPRRGLANLSDQMVLGNKLVPEDRFLQFSSHAFDMSVEEIFPPLYGGATLVLRTEEMISSGRHFLEGLEDKKITLLNMPTAFWLEVLHEIAENGGQIPERMRLITVGGEEVPIEKARIWQQNVGDLPELINSYGPTEASVNTTVFTISGADLDGIKTPIGVPLENYSVWILDENQRLTAPGVPGELWIGGLGLAREYYRSPELTAERFQNIQLTSDLKLRLYNSGDVVRYLPNGNIEFHGRADHQVKIRGFRVEPGEVEDCLSRYPGIREVAVVAWDHPSPDAYLAAYFTVSEGVEVEALRKFLQGALPNYMVPAFLITLEEMPLHGPGKVNRKALPEPQTNDAAEDGSKAALPANEIEAGLIEVWESVLNRKVNSTSADFFEMGGHSLKAMRLISLVLKRFSCEFKLRDVFMTPVLKNQAELIQNRAQTQFIPIEKAPQADWYRLSNAQERLWMVSQLDDVGASYNMPTAFLIKGELQIMHLEAALRSLQARHEILRTSIETIDNKPVQIVHPEAEFQLEVVDMQGHSEVQAKAREVILSDVALPIALSENPLWRVKLLVLAEKEFVLQINHHHIIMDGWSDGIFLGELFTLYQSYSSGNPNPFLPLSIQYKDYAVWEDQEAQILKKQAGERFWLDKLAGELPLLDLPIDFPRKKKKSYQGDYCQVGLDSGTTQAFKKMCSEVDASLFMGLNAVLKVLLSRLSGQTDIIVGTVVAGRSHPDLHQQLGLFLNTLALRDEIRPDEAFVHFLMRVKEGVTQALHYQDYPFEKLVESVETGRDLSRQPVFDVMLVLQNNEEAEGSGLSDLEIVPVETGGNGSKFDINFTCSEVDGRLSVVMEYCNDLFTPERMSAIGEQFMQLIAEVVKAPMQEVKAINILSEKQQSQLLEDFQGGEANFYGYQNLAEVLAKNAGSFPDRIAVLHSSGDLSFKELEAESNRFARMLRDRFEMQAGELIVLNLEPSTELPVAIMGAFKARVGVVMVDPEWPAERKNFVLEDSSSRVLISSDALEPEGREEILATDLTGLLADFDAQSLNTAYDLNDTSFIQYSSGSTGNPKGAILTQGGMLNFAFTYRNYFDFGSKDIMPQKTTVGFGDSLIEIILPLTAGASTLYLRPEGVSTKDPKGLMDWFAEIGASHIQFVPSVYEAWSRVIDFDALSSMKALIFSGEELKKHYQAPCPVYNIYGNSECTCDATYFEVEDKGDILIGAPGRGTNVYVLDAHQQLVAAGTPGEMYLGGAMVARGYLNRPALTEEKFLPDPFRPGAFMYRTGDLVHWTNDGNLKFLGRIDRQVKIRGQRIEPGEIEQKLIAYPEVEQALVIAASGSDGSDFLCAYVQGKSDISLNLLRTHLRKDLPEYMVPVSYMVLDEFPLNSSGKLDLARLPEAEETVDLSRSESSELTLPETELEHQLHAIWQEVLGETDQQAKDSQIGVEDNFFDIGGNSLKMITLISRINESLNLDLPFMVIFNASNIRTLAQTIIRLREMALDQDPATPLLLNAAGKSPVFLFPPGIGFSMVYRPLASELENHSLYGFNFVDSPDRFERYADAIEAIQPTGDVVVMGWSAGGNLAFEAAKALEDRGRKVAGLIIFDSVRREEADEYSPEKVEEVLDQATEMREDVIESVFLSKALQEQVKQMIRASQKFSLLYEDEGSIAADIFFLKATDNALYKYEDEWKNWENGTSGKLFFYQGAGTHERIMTPPHLAENTSLLREILNRILSEA